MIRVGIDAGAATTKVVVTRDGTVLGWKVVPSGFDFTEAARRSYQELMEDHGLSAADVGSICATGYGRNAIAFADRAVSEITAHARGVHLLFPRAAGIIDIGGQDSKVIAVAEGRVVDFLMNDKCAAGTGKFLEHSARALEVTVEELGHLALASTEPARISSMCTVFAESEVISLRAKGRAKQDIAAGLVGSIAERVAVMAKRVGLNHDVAFVGGVAKNQGMRAALEREMGFPLFVPQEPQITGALGAAMAPGRSRDRYPR